MVMQTAVLSCEKEAEHTGHMLLQCPALPLSPVGEAEVV